MMELEERDRRITALRVRLTRLSEASLRINDSLDPDAVLQRVLDSARSLTGAVYGVMTTLDDEGGLEEVLASGMTEEEAERLWAMPGGMELFEYLRGFSGPMRVADFASHTRERGLPEFLPPLPMSSFLSAPIRHRGDEVGSIHVAKRESGEEFSREDEETLAMFASQAALVIANARRYRDEQLARSYLETLVETSPVGVAVFDTATGAPTSLNREMMRIVEYLSDEGQTPEELLEALTCRRADGREVSLKEWPLAELLTEGETVRAEEIEVRVPDGRSVTALLNGTPIRGDGGEAQSFMVTLQDMAPVKELERLRAEFLGMVSHELRTPLTSIIGSATTMQASSEDMDPAELRQFLRIIVNQGDNMRDLIDDLLDVARIETGTLSVKPEPAEVGVLVDRARNTFLSGGGRGNLDIELPQDLPLVMADRRRIAQVIGNLLANAARHSPKSSTIRVSAMRDGANVAVSVTDEGRGIPAEELSGLFRNFSAGAGEEGGGGAGMGLAICKGIVEAHGGRIWAQSEGTRLGARFSFTIPVVEEAGSEGEHSAPSGLRQESKEERILVVDDDPQMLMQIRNCLLEAGYYPMVTGDPEEAVSLARENRPSLYLLDMILPGSDGIALMQDVLSVASAPVVFLSAYGHEQMIERAFQAGATDYIVKPFTPTELAARVRAALLRREGSFGNEALKPYALGDLRIDYTERQVSLRGSRVHMTRKEYDLLRVLSVNAGRVLTHGQLLRRLWDSGKPGDIRGLRTLMRRLRRKLGESASNPTYFFSEPRVGYRMAKGEEEEEGDASE